MARYALAAEHLGRFNALWLADRGRLRPDWWSRDAIEDWVEALGSTLPGFLGDDACWSEPVVRAELPANARDELGRLWAQRSRARLGRNIAFVLEWANELERLL